VLASIVSMDYTNPFWFKQAVWRYLSNYNPFE